MGEKLGADPHKLSDIFSVSTGRCWSVDTYNPLPGYLPGVPASNNYEGGFMIRLVMKDLSLAIEAAQSVGAVSEETQRAYDMYARINELGYGDRDFGIVY